VRWLNRLVGWFVAAASLVWRLTLRVSFENDRRAELLGAGKGLTVALLHAHQIAGVLGFDDKRSCVMVSRSRDGDLIAPSLSIRGIGVARGSAKKRGIDKGGRTALAELGECVAGGGTALLTVDGPQGPRNRVRRGVASLAAEQGVPILPVVILASRYWLLERSWDRLQIPKPFSRVTFHWGDPIRPEGKSLLDLCNATAQALRDLEQRFHPEEAKLVAAAAERAGR